MRMFLISILFLVGCDPSWMDNGLMVRDGVELHREEFPLIVSVEGYFDHPTAPTVGLNLFNAYTERYAYIYENAAEPDVIITQGFVPGEYDDGVYDLTTVEYDRETGNIIHCDIVLSSDYSYDFDLMVLVVIHAFGHCVGLDDDPGPPETVDLRSIMSKPFDPLGELTRHDIEIVREMIDTAASM